MRNILIAEPGYYSDEAINILGRIGQVRHLSEYTDDLTEHVKDVDILVVRLAYKIDKRLFQACPRLTIVATSTTGLDHIDLEEAGRRNVRIVSLRGETEFLQGIRATSEHTFAILLALIRRLPEAIKSIDAGIWEQQSLIGSELAGKTIGVLGCGRLGSRVVQIARGFDMNCLAYDPYLTNQEIEKYGAKPCDLKTLLPLSDIVTIHIPLLTETLNFFSKELISQMKPTAVLVNTSRGKVVDEVALVEALTNRKLAGAAVDVLSFEQESEDVFSSPLAEYQKTHDNVIITPHIAGTTKESLDNTQVFIARKILQSAIDKTLL